MTRASRTSLIVVALGLILATAVPASASRERAADTLQLANAITGLFGGVACPQDAPSGSACFAINNHGVIRGLGHVSESGVLVIRAPDTACEVWQSTPVLTGKGGTIELSVHTPAGGCVNGGCGCGAVNVTQGFTITGGTGDYADASGSGTVVTAGQIPSGQTDTLNGTIVAPSTTFDLTPPVFSGASAKTVRAPKGEKPVRVRYTVRANDDVDGTLPAICAPASGSSFRIGRTRVTCTATDSSANTATAGFTVTVKR